VEVTIDKAGRIVIPKSVRDDLHLQAGDSLELDRQGDALQLRPVRAKVPLRKRKGRWVFNSGLGNWDVVAAINEMREERMRDILK
jgi:AbrB family looped-hinge helix DNA binding protein